MTFTILGWKHIFTSDKYRSLIYKWFDYIKGEYRNKVHGYVTMPNHLHCLMFISDKSPKLSTFIQNAKRFMAYQIVRLLKKDGDTETLDFFRENARIKFGAKHKVFEDGFDSLIIQSQKIFLEKLNYIHNNPCQEKWKLAEYPEDYPYSSAANYILEKGIYDVDVIEF